MGHHGICVVRRFERVQEEAHAVCVLEPVRGCITTINDPETGYSGVVNLYPETPHIFRPFGSRRPIICPYRTPAEGGA